jgi:hypothetical protein
LVEREFYNGVGDGEFGLEDFVGFLLAVELLLVGRCGGGDGGGGRYEVCRGEGRFEVGLPVQRKRG